MDENTLKIIAAANLPNQICPLTGRSIVEQSVLHRDLSDWWPSSLHDMRDDRIANLLIVEKKARDSYYSSLNRSGIVLAFSGGLDSATVLNWCCQLFGSVHCLIFDYGQRHKIEISKAIDYINYLRSSFVDGIDDHHARVSYEIVDASMIGNLASSALTKKDIEVPRNNSLEEMGSCIPKTFVPGRNLYFITALAQAAFQRSWRHIALGVNHLDYSGYPDCRPEFIAKMRDAITIGVFNGIDIAIHAPLMYLDKVKIIRLGRELGVNYALTHSCYNGVDGGCGECDSCLIRRAAFRQLGTEDPSIK